MNFNYGLPRLDEGNLISAITLIGVNIMNLADGAEKSYATYEAQSTTATIDSISLVPEFKNVDRTQAIAPKNIAGIYRELSVQLGYNHIEEAIKITTNRLGEPWDNANMAQIVSTIYSRDFPIETEGFLRSLGTLYYLGSYGRPSLVLLDEYARIQWKDNYPFVLSVLQKIMYSAPLVISFSLDILKGILKNVGCTLCFTRVPSIDTFESIDEEKLLDQIYNYIETGNAEGLLSNKTGYKGPSTEMIIDILSGANTAGILSKFHLTDFENWAKVFRPINTAKTLADACPIVIDYISIDWLVNLVLSWDEKELKEVPYVTGCNL